MLKEHNVRFVKRRIFVIGKTMPDYSEITAWLKFIGVSNEGIAGIIKWPIPPAGLIPTLAAKRCYKSFEPGINPLVTRVRDDVAAYIDNILEHKHGSVLEHCSFTFAIENVSRVLTAELNRHRAGAAISEGSMRFIGLVPGSTVDLAVVPSTDYDEDICANVFLPKWYRHYPNFDQIVEDIVNKYRATSSRELSLNGTTLQDMITEMGIGDHETEVHTLQAYIERCIQASNASVALASYLASMENMPKDAGFADKKTFASRARRNLRMGIASGGVWSWNLRTLRHIITKRGASGVEEEILALALEVLEIMMRELKPYFGDFSFDSKNSVKPRYDSV